METQPNPTAASEGTSENNEDNTMNEYYVTIPIAGHAYIHVKASSEEEAIEKAMDAVTIEHVETWEPLEEFNRGNTCNCPSPWKVKAELEEDD